MENIQDASASSGPAIDDPDAASIKAAMRVPVTVMLGPMGTLLRKLHWLMAPGQSLAPDLLRVEEVSLLSDGLKKLCISLKNMSEDEDPSFMVQWWMKIVRELCYDTEDHLDEVCCAGTHHDFSELLARAEDAIESRQCFEWSPPRTTKPVHPGEAGVSRRTSLELPVPLPVHVEPPKKLVELLDFHDDGMTLKVIPITECAGVGKTTAARALYHKHASRFQCRAFVTVSRNPDMRGFLSSILSQLKAPSPHRFPDVPDLIDAIRKHLQGKRYIIVIDDLWTSSVWNIVSHAFPRGDYCSRIITTTQIDDVALACCSYDPVNIYKMFPLNDPQSRKLFFGIVFGSEDGCPIDIKEVSYDIVKKCTGLPLAIVNIASLLASESNIARERWQHIQDSLPSTSEEMMDVLNLLYNILPHLMYNSLRPRLRTCLLYLSMYSEGHVIKKDELLKLWAAEGFLSAVGGRNTQEIAEDCFDELVSRGMVQAVDTNNNGEVLTCTVHRMVLDFIRLKSMEENFVINMDLFQSTLALPDKVRRLSVQFGGVKGAYIPESIVTSQVRSLIFWGFYKCVPSIMDCGLLRILILHIWADEENESFDLTGIGELFLLKYLDIECNITVKLPDTGKIRWLQYLETLKVNAKVVAFPSDIVLMERLLHLRLLSEYILPSLVARMTSLHTLGYFDIGSHSEENVLHLGRLNNLQDLQLTCSTVQPAENLQRNVQFLGSILEKLTVLQSLSLVPDTSGSSCVNILEDGLNMATPPPDLPLQRIELSRHCCVFVSLPKWFGELMKLCILKIAIRKLSMNDTDMLKGLPSLTALTLYIQTVSSDRMVIKEEGFQALTYFKLICATPCLSFGQGAMPKVQKLTIGFNANQRRSYTFGTFAFSNLTGLTEVSIKLGVRHADDVNIKVAETALENSFKHHQNTLMLRVECIAVIFYHEEDRSTPTQEVKNKITEIQEDKKEITESSEKHVSKLWPVESRYARTDLVPFMEYHAPSASVVTGTFGSIFHKLRDLERDDSPLLMRGRYSIRFLRDELEGMLADLQEVAKLEQAELNIRMWANEVREFSYVTEDAIDSILGLQYEKANLLRKALMKLGWIARPDIAKAIDEIRETAAKFRRTGDIITAKTKASRSLLGDHTEQWMHPEFQDPNVMVGVEVLRDEVIGMLKQGTSAEATKQPKIVSIFGIGGLGKTTLAKAVYDRIQVGYTYNAFVSVSRNPDMKKVFMDILLQIDKQKYTSLSGGATVDATQVIGVIRELLANKRYFFVVDDIWHEESWEVIRNILIENEHENVVLTTTRIVEVAEEADEVYKLTTLSHSQSEELFYTRLFGGKGNIPSAVPKESKTLLQACGGVPLAIITLAVLLAGKRMDCWPRVCEDWFSMCKRTSFSDQHQGNYDTEANTRAILLLIYYELPDYLRTCLLYLSIFPDNYAIQKETLIWKWVAEGLVDEESGRLFENRSLFEKGERSLFEKGESYFSKLIHSSLIVPIVDSRRQIITGCRLHGLVFDMIHKLSTDVNFVTIMDGNKQPSPTDAAKQKIMLTDRRLAVQMGAMEKGDPLSYYTAPERLRSFNATGFHFVTELPLAKFGLVRVLALEECTFFKGRSNHLKHLGKLHLLRYLGLYNTPIEKLPKEIGDLINLQTLDLRGTTLKELPRGVAQLSKLKCLRVDEDTSVPDLHFLISLEELRLGNVHFSADFAYALLSLRELRELEIWIEKLNENEKSALAESVTMLREIHVLRVMGQSSSDDEHNWEHFVPPLQLHELHLTIAFSRLPAWIREYHVPMLSHLCVNVKVVDEHDLYILGSLRELISLELLLPSHIFPTIMGDGAFPKLRCFNTSTAFSFSEWAMPRMEFLHFKVDVPALKDPKVQSDDGFVASTLKNLRSIKKMEVEISSNGDIEAIHEALKRAVDEHPNSPSLHVVKTGQGGTAHQRLL